MFDLKNYESLRDNSSQLYHAAKQIFSPALNTKITFSSEGFNHIIFRSPRNEREKSSQILRFKLLPLAKKLISLSTTYQEYEEIIKEYQIKKHKNKILQHKIIKYWGIIAIIQNQKIKVILRKIGDSSEIQFWSVIPSWTTTKHRDIKLFKTMTGLPEED